MQIPETPPTNITGWRMSRSSSQEETKYMNCRRVPSGALLMRVRTGRGRHVARFCRARDLVRKTNNHVLQIFYRMHCVHTKRYNAVVAYIYRHLRRQGSSNLQEEELRCQTMEGFCKPDLVANKGQHGVVIDDQVAGRQPDLRRARCEEICKYAENWTLTIRTIAPREKPASFISRQSFSREDCGPRSQLTAF